MKYTVVCPDDYISYIDAELKKIDREEDSVRFIKWDGRSFMKDSAHFFVGVQEQLKQKEYDILLIAIYDNRWLSRLLTFLHEIHVDKVYVLRAFTIQKRLSFIKSKEEPQENCFIDGLVDEVNLNTNKPYLVHLETHVVDHCNLNCKACNNFSPFVREPRFANLESFSQDIRNLSEKFYQIGRFFLLGGEPLLDPERCCEMVRIYRKYFHDGEVRVLTNASLILSMKENFWNCMREHNVIIHISLYPPIKEKINQIIIKIEKENVDFIVHKEVSKFGAHWTLSNIEDAEYNNERCGSGGCHFFKDGYIYKCPDSKLIGELSDAVGMSRDSLETKDAQLINSAMDGWEIIKKLDSPIDKCKMCNFRYVKLIEWEMAGKDPDINDWLISSSFEIENDKLHHENAKLCSTNLELKQELEELAADLYRTNNSKSMKIGLLMTWVPRKVQSLFNKESDGKDTNEND